MRRTITLRARGQSLIVVVLFLALIFFIIGLAIDGGLLYSQRRLMQNAADAACLAAANRLALSQTADVARSAATDVVAKMIGPGPGQGTNAPGTLQYASVAELYDPAEGSGNALTRGIEVSGAGVRVALRVPGYTYFMRLLGISSYTVAARSRCNSSDGGGATPFAVARWRGYKNASPNADPERGLTTDRALPQQYSGGSGSNNMVVRDILGQSASSQLSQWPGWGSDIYPGTPEDRNGLYSQATAPATPASPGFETVIAGNGAYPNMGDNSFTGPVVLDYRQTTFPQPLFYNGLTPDTALNTYKDYASRYIAGTYPGPDVIPGQQLGFYNGVSAGQIEKPFNLRYTVGSTVTVLIYNGTVYNTPNFATSYPAASDDDEARTGPTLFSGSQPGGCEINGSPNYAPLYLYDGQVQDAETPVNLSPASYSLNVDPDNAGLFKLRAFFSADPAAWNDLQGRWNNGSWTNFNLNGAAPTISAGTDSRTFSLDVRASRTEECTYLKYESGVITPTETLVTIPAKPRVGAETIYLEAQDTGTNTRRARYAFLNVQAESNDFYAYFPGELAYEPFEPGRPTVSTPFNIETVGGTQLAVNDGTITGKSFDWFSTGQTSIGAPADISAALKRQGQNNYLDITVGDNALTGKEYYLRVTIKRTVGSKTYTHWAWYYVQVRAPLNNSSSITQFVYALGYATFRITEINSNSIKARAVSGLLRPEEVVAGMQPRLVPWEE